MISKRVTILLAVSALALTACGKENTAVDASIDFAKSESVAQNLQQAMADMTSAAAETKEEVNTKVETEIAALPEVETVDTLDADDLMGTWLMVGGEIEGDVWEAIPGNYEILSISLEPNPADGTEMLFADMEARDYEGIINKSFYQQKIESLDEPLYDGCGNEAWSVRFGDESEKNENGYPIHEEYYATLLDRNTLLLQQYFTIDGGPGVSYQTFKRVFPGEDVEYVDSQILQEQWAQGNSSVWELEYYIDENGNKLPLPSNVADLSIESSGEISWTDQERSIDFEYLSVWGYGRGGSVLITSEDGYSAWFAGAVAREYDKELDGNAALKMHLYHDGGWLCLREVNEPEIPILNVMKTTLSREEYENNEVICSSIRDSVRLSDQDAVLYPKLALALEQLTKEDMETMEDSLSDAKERYDESNPEFCSEIDEEMLFVQRADRRILSLRKEFYSYLGGVHPIYGALGYNFDSETGEKLELDDVVTDFEQAMELVEQKLFEIYDKEAFYPDVEEMFDKFTPGEISWIMGYQGITFLFNPYAVAPYASGLMEVTLWYQDTPELFVERYAKVPEDGYVVSLALGRAHEFDCDHTDGWADLLTVYPESSNGYAFDKLTITLNESTYEDTDICLYEMSAYLVCTGEHGRSNYYLYIYGPIEDGHKMYVYDLNQKEIKRTERIENVFFPGDWYSGVEEFEVYYEPVLTDPTGFTMQSKMWTMGLFLGEKDYYVNPETGLIQSKKVSYSIPESTWPITSKVPLILESLVEEEMVEFPPGSIFYYDRTDGVSYVDVYSESRVKYRIEIDTTGEYTLVNGMCVEECFDGVTKIW